MLHGICHGIIGPPRGFAGRTLLGRQTIPYKAAAPGGANSIAARLQPNAAVGDIFICGIGISPSNAAFHVRADGTYYADVQGSTISQVVSVDGYSKVFSGLYGEGTLILNDRPPVPASGNKFIGNLTIAFGIPFSVQLLAIDPDGNPITWSVVSGVLPPGTSINPTTGIWSGTPTTLGSFGFTIRVSDQFGAFTDVPDSAVVSAVLPDFTGQQLSVASAVVISLGLSVASSQTASALPVNQIISQTPIAHTPITTIGTVTFVVSDGSLFVGPVNVFPTNIQGLTWEGSRSVTFVTNFNDSITGKPSTSTYTQYPTIEWDLNYELLNQAAAQDDLKKIVGLFNQQQGQATWFLYVDPAFNSVVQEVFFVGNNVTKQAQLTAQYRIAGGPGIPEMIQALQNPSAVVLRDITAGVNLVQGTDYTIGATGIITFTSAPALNHQIAWSGNFYYICKFVSDDLNPDQFMQQFWSLQSIKFRSVIL